MVEDCSLIPICPVNDPLLLLSLRPISSSYLILWFFLPISPLIPVPPLCIMPGPALLPFASLSHAALPQGVGVGGSVANTEQNLSQNMVAGDVLCGWKEQLEQIRYYLASQDWCMPGTQRSYEAFCCKTLNKPPMNVGNWFLQASSEYSSFHGKCKRHIPDSRIINQPNLKSLLQSTMSEKV